MILLRTSQAQQRHQPLQLMGRFQFDPSRLRSPFSRLSTLSSLPGRRPCPGRDHCFCLIVRPIGRLTAQIRPQGDRLSVASQQLPRRLSSRFQISPHRAHAHNRNNLRPNAISIPLHDLTPYHGPETHEA